MHVHVRRPLHGRPLVGYALSELQRLGLEGISYADDAAPGRTEHATGARGEDGACAGRRHMRTPSHVSPQSEGTSQGAGVHDCGFGMRDCGCGTHRVRWPTLPFPSVP
ncbi:hypothetical protein Ctob_005766 [Chrysochromulina tobinii]|uniref:Uncharacterized protein n=1 Tax=Chrysochromulina tobinii TaxID=1460289 RepID=A0A0M0JJA1_9EUKA|nr:hypothetical protein Ctob_005766 [Chrysochromulina tobinii]|eukprot:KOO26671.1 hypothetical protein Ctob_005766 [Chrysochromulina sp. CCMP291]